MNVVSIAGGLGNQMFQYAFGLLLPGPVKYDLSWFEQQEVGLHRRNYGLGSFNCSPAVVSEAELADLVRKRHPLNLFVRSLRPFVEWPRGRFNAESLKLRNRLIRGYFQVARYYEPLRERLRAEFTLRISPDGEAWREVMSLARQERSVAVHVRRGDYLELRDIYPACGLDYYQRAANLILSRLGRANFLVFSDDLPWARDNLKLPGTTTFVDLASYRREELDMMAMRECHHNIIANSTYSWWGAWLNANPNKIVIAPKGKFSADQQELALDDWESV